MLWYLNIYEFFVQNTVLVYIERFVVALSEVYLFRKENVNFHDLKKFENRRPSVAFLHFYSFTIS